MNARPSVLATVLGGAVLSAPAAAAQDASVVDAADATLDAVAPPIDVSAAAPEPFVPGPEQQLPMGHDLVAVLHPPAEWSKAPVEVSVPDFAEMPEARVALALTWVPSALRDGRSDPAARPASRLSIVCATAPSTDWTDGMEAVVFERASELARKHLETSIIFTGGWETASAMPRPPLITQDFSARGYPGSRTSTDELWGLPDLAPQHRLSISGRHALAFAASSDTAVVCSVVCVQRAAHDTPCGAIVSNFRIDGPLTDQPDSTRLGRVALALRRMPTAMVGVAVGTLLALVGVGMFVRGLLLANADRRFPPAPQG